MPLIVPEYGPEVFPPSSVEFDQIRRPGAITAAAVICGVLGGLSLLAALFFSFAAGFLTRAPIEMPALPFVGVLTLIRALGTAILATILGVGYLAACGLLLRSKKNGGLIGITVGAVGIALGGLGLAGVFVPVSAIGIAGIAAIVLIVLSWSKLS